MTIAKLSTFWSGGRLNGRAETRETRKWITELDVRPPESEKLISELSGGNAQKVVMARWLRDRPACSCSTSRPRASTSARRPTSTASSTPPRQRRRRRGVFHRRRRTGPLGDTMVVLRGRAGAERSAPSIETSHIEQEQLLPVTDEESGGTKS